MSFIIIMHNNGYFLEAQLAQFNLHFLFHSVTSASMKHLLQLRFIRILMAESVNFLNESGSEFYTKWIFIHDEMEFYLLRCWSSVSKIYTEKFIQIFSQIFVS